jgi:hypothetical protein
VKTDAFDNVKDQIGYCGIWCGSCVVGTGALMELTRRYRELVTSYGLHEWGPRDVDYDSFYAGLKSIQGAPACPGCLKGGGRDDCDLRACATGKGLDECRACEDQAECMHADLLEHMRSGAKEAGLFVKDEDGPREELLAEWKAALKSRWPFYLLFPD